MLKKLNLFILFTLFIAANSSSGESLIDIVLKSRESIVSVYAIQTGMIKSPHASAGIDPKTGKILIARNIKAAQFKKSGAGVIISPDGLIVTNFHIINNADKVSIKFFNGSSVSAKIAHILPKQDLALLKVNPPLNLSPIEFSDSNDIALGEEIIHIGTSEILDETISGGRIIGLATSSLNKNDKKNVELIKINVNIYKGDSGGPLLDKNGRLIGMMAAKLMTKNKASFAIPSNKIKRLYLEAIK